LPGEEGDGFKVQVERRGATVIVAFDGELDMAVADAVTQALSQALSDQATTVVVDLQDLQFMDLTGVRCLMKAKRQADEASRRFAVLNGSQPAHRLLTLTRADESLEMVDDFDQLEETPRP
jgi:anti-anti-sigma factor